MSQRRNKILKRYFIHTFLTIYVFFNLFFSTDYTLLDSLIIKFYFPLRIFSSSPWPLGQLFTKAQCLELTTPNHRYGLMSVDYINTIHE